MRALCFVVCFICIGELSSQNRLEFGAYTGQLFKHKESIDIEVNGGSYGLGAALLIQTDGSKSWHEAWSFPEVEQHIHYYFLGDSKVTGHALAYVPSMSFKLMTRGSFSVHASAGFGIAYVSKQFSYQDNPTNNAIGSAINNGTLYRLFVRYSNSKKYRYSAGISFSHYSNGLNQTPNFGINIPAAFIAVDLNKKASNTLKNLDQRNLDENLTHKKRFSFDVSLGAARNETGAIPGGPKYRVYASEASIGYRIWPYSQMVIGLGYEFHGENYAFVRNQLLDRETALASAQRVMTTIGYEAFFGKTSFRYEAGLYNYAKSRKGTIMNRLIIRHYYLGEKRSIKPFIGLQLKTHITVAEYLGVIAGVSF